MDTKQNKTRVLQLLTFMFFTMFIGILINTQQAKATPWEVAPDFMFSPMPNGNVILRKVEGARFYNEYSLEGDTYSSYDATNGMTATYANVGRYNGIEMDMKIRLTNINNTGNIGFDVKHFGILLGDKSDYVRNLSNVRVNVWFTQANTNTRVNFNAGDKVGMAYTELEPNWFMTTNNVRHESLNQYVTAVTQPVAVGPYKEKSVIDGYKAVRGHYQTLDGAVVPWGYYNRTGYLYNFYNNFTESSVIAVYQPGNQDIIFNFNGGAYSGDLFQLNGQALPSPDQQKPVKSVSLNESSGYGTSTTIVNTDAPFYYDIKQQIAYDPNHNGTGFKVVDDLPVGSKIKDVKYNHDVWNVKFSGRHFEASAKKDVYKAPMTHDFKIQALIDDTVTLTNRTVYNDATSTPSGGANGGGTSNKVDVTIPKPKQPAPEKDISVTGPNSGWTRPKESISTISQPFFYRLQQTIKRDPFANGTGTIITDTLPEGTKINKVTTDDPGVWDIKFSGRNFTATAKTNILKQTKKYNFYISAQTTADIKETTTQLFNTAETHVTPSMDGGGKSNTVELDIPKPKKDINAALDWIELDTQKASTHEFPLSYRWHFTDIAKEPLVNTSAMSGNELTDATATNNWFKGQLDSLKYELVVDNKTTGQNSVYKAQDTYRSLQANAKDSNPITKVLNKAVKDGKLTANKDNMLAVRLSFSGAPGLRLTADQKATTYINTASEKVFTNSDLKNGKISYEHQVRTILDVKADKLTSFKESYDFNFTDKVTQKTGYYDVSDMNMKYHNDIEKSTRIKDYTTTLPKEFLNDYKGTDAKLNHTNGKITMEKSDEKTTDAASKVAIPDLPDLTKWSGKGYDVVAHYPHAYSEVRTGNLFTADQVKKGDKNIKSDLVDGGNRLYLPIWLKVNNYEGKYNLEDAEGTKGELGVNAISFKFTKKFDAFAQMYSDQKSDTKKKDELYVQPVFANSDYKNVKGLTSAGKRWVTSVNTENADN